MRCIIIIIMMSCILYGSWLKAAEENPDKKKGVTFHLKKSSKYRKLPEPPSNIVPGGIQLDWEGQILQKQPPEGLSDDDEPGDAKKGRAEEKKQFSLEDIKLSEKTTAAGLLRTYEIASIQEAPIWEAECAKVLTELRDSENNAFEIFQAALGIAQVKRMTRFQSEIVRLAQSPYFPKGTQIDVSHSDLHAGQSKQCRGCCLCNK